MSALFIGGCAAKVLKFEKQDHQKAEKEFEQVVKIEMPAAAEPTGVPSENASVAQSKKSEKDQKPSSAVKDKKSKTAKVVKSKVPEKTDKSTEKQVLRRQPEIESDIGFDGRRPLVDPFRVGEKVTHRVHYFKVTAGQLSFEVKPFVVVNGRKAYNFRTSIVTSSLFSSFYTADDFSETLVDYENLTPSVFTLHVQESAQIKEAKSFFDFEKRKAIYWENKITEKNGKEEKRQEWELEEYSQNVFSAAYYMRNFQWKVGEENLFRVSDDGENITFRGKAIRKETLETEVGTFEAIVVKPEFELKGVFKPVGDIYIWLSNDDRKYILKIESKIKIGTLVSEIIELAPGKP